MQKAEGRRQKALMQDLPISPPPHLPTSPPPPLSPRLTYFSGADQPLFGLLGVEGFGEKVALTVFAV